MELLDVLDFDAPIPFSDTVPSPGRIMVNIGLGWTDRPRYVMELIRHDHDVASDASSSEEDDGPVMLTNFASLNGVNATGFGPGGADSEGAQFRVYDNEQATWPPTRKLVLKPPRGPPIIVTPRCMPRRKVTRGCVELAVSEWMERQRRLPDGQRNTVEIDMVQYTADGEVKHVPVWLWNGLQQVMGEPNTFKICLD